MDNTEQKLRQYRKLFKHQQAPNQTPPLWRTWPLLLVTVLGLCLAAAVLVAIRGAWQHENERQERQRAEKVATQRRESPVQTKIPIEVWHEKLHDPNVQVQLDALAYLTKERPVEPTTVAEIRKLLSDERLQGKVAEALGAIGYEAWEAADELVELASNGSSADVRQASLFALLRVNPFRVLELPDEVDPMLVSALEHHDLRTRRFAMCCVGARKPSDGSVKIELTTLAAQSWDSSQSAAFVLRQISTPEKLSDVPIKELVHRLQSYDREVANYFETTGPHLALRLIDELASAEEVVLTGYTRDVVRNWGIAAMPSYLNAIKHSDQRKALAATVLLKELGAAATPAVPELIKALDRGGSKLKSMAIETLRTIGPGARESLTAVQQEFDAHPTAYLAVTLYCIDPTEQRLETVRRIIEPDVLKDYDTTVHPAYGELMIMRPLPVPLIINVMSRSRSDFIRIKMAEALIEHKDEVEPHVELLISALRIPPKVKAETFPEDSVDPARLAADVLGQLGPRATPAVSDLLALVDSQSHWVKRSAIRALGKVTTAENAQDVVNTLVPKTSDEGPIHLEAQLALKRIGVGLSSGGDPPDLAHGTLLAAITPDSIAKPSRIWRRPIDIGEQRHVDTPAAGAVEDVLQAVNKWRAWPDSPELPQLLRAIGKGGDDLRSAAPLLLLILESAELSEEGRLAAVTALWKLTRSPLLSAVILESEAAPVEVIEELGPDAGALAPILFDRRGLGHHRGGFACEVHPYLLLPLIGPKAREVAPRLHRVLATSKGGIDGAMAGLALWRLESDPAVVLELLRQFHADGLPYQPRDQVGQHVAWVLGKIGPPAISAIPILVEPTYLDRRETGEAAAWAIAQIDRKAAGRWGVLTAKD